VKVDSKLQIERDELTRHEWEVLFKKLTFTDIDDVEIASFQHRNGSVLIPRGAWSLIPDKITYTDLRSRPAMRKVAYTKQLDAPGYEGQTAAIAKMFHEQQGLIVAPPGRGKTEMALAFIAASKTRALVVVHTTELFDQWVSRAQQSTPGLPVGKIQGSVFNVEHLTVAMAQTLKRYLRDKALWRQFGCLIIDEAHHSGAETWEWILNVCPAYYRFGFTATDKRADARHPLLRHRIGPVIYRLAFKSQVPVLIVPVETGVKILYRGPYDWAKMLRILCANPDRNALIAKIIKRELDAGNSMLVLSGQIKHLEHIAEAVGKLDHDLKGKVAIITARMPGKLRKQRMDAFKAGELPCVLATQLADEGLDVPHLNRIIFSFPGKFDGKTVQRIGRGTRQHESKTETIIYDLVDDKISPLARQYVSRKRTYKRLAKQDKNVTLGKVERYAKSKKGRNLRGVFRVRRPGSDR
jgi:superfamily II DNA or RNA helicase